MVEIPNLNKDNKVYKLMVNYYNDDAGYFMTEFIAISPNVNELKSKAVEYAECNTPVWDEIWEETLVQTGKLMYKLSTGDKYGETYFIDEEIPL